MSKIQEMLEEELREARREGFQEGVEYVQKKYVLIEKGKFVDWAVKIVSVVKELEYIDNVEDAPEAEPPASKKRKRKQKPDPVKPVPAKPGIRLTPEDEAAIDKAIDERAKTGKPADVNW